MPATIVVDAWAAAAVVFREPAARVVVPHLLGARSFVVPQIFGLELANIGRSKVLRGELTWEDARVLLEDAGTWPWRQETVEWSDAWDRARATGLTVYDAAYLALSEGRRLPLLSLDEALIAAAGRRALR